MQIEAFFPAEFLSSSLFVFFFLLESSTGQTLFRRYSPFYKSRSRNQNLFTEPIQLLLWWRVAQNIVDSDLSNLQLDPVYFVISFFKSSMLHFIAATTVIFYVIPSLVQWVCLTFCWQYSRSPQHLYRIHALFKKRYRALDAPKLYLTLHSPPHSAQSKTSAATQLFSPDLIQRCSSLDPLPAQWTPIVPTTGTPYTNISISLTEPHKMHYLTTGSTFHTKVCPILHKHLHTTSQWHYCWFYPFPLWIIEGCAADLGAFSPWPGASQSPLRHQREAATLWTLPPDLAHCPL